MRWHRLASPTLAMTLISIVLLIVGRANGWSNGAVGSAIVGVFAATIVVTECFAPNGSRRRARRPR